MIGFVVFVSDAKGDQFCIGDPSTPMKAKPEDAQAKALSAVESAMSSLPSDMKFTPVRIALEFDLDEFRSNLRICDVKKE